MTPETVNLYDALHHCEFYGSDDKTRALAETYNKILSLKSTVGEINFAPWVDRDWMRRFTQCVPVAFVVPNSAELTEAAEHMLQIVHALNRCTPVLGFLLRCAWLQLPEVAVDQLVQPPRRVMLSYPHVSIHQVVEAEKILEGILRMRGLEQMREFA